MADDELVSRAKSGDPDAWRTLYRDHAGRLVAWLATRPTGDAAAEPEDVASEAWTVAAAKIADFEGSASDFAGWLFTIARQISATTRRTAERRRTTPGTVPDGADVAADPSAVVQQTQWVRDALATLTARERAAVGLVDGLGVDPGTAADILGISAVALRVARHRGLKRLNRARVTPRTGIPREVTPGP